MAWEYLSTIRFVLLIFFQIFRIALLYLYDYFFYFQEHAISVEKGSFTWDREKENILKK